jgi:hypothetical protein
MRYYFNVFLCAIGLLGYLVFLGWAVIGVWPLCYYVLRSIVLMMTTGLPVVVNVLGLLLPLSLLASYYSLSSPLIGRVFFRHFFLLRPILIVGTVFLAGLSLTHTVLFRALNAGLESRPTILAIGIAGIIVTRVFMSWLFKKIPVERLAFR